ncbi:hypothetical protein SAMN05192529_111111 [Arachidicoccus rhizosphaerae]|uniref:Lipocalin-like domain-containing protein n=1 Tax=Arachidicoccus rhizosphaerae TaxID=551991 RepID=A0A1H3ZLQ3_9BACT|nr:hypothetical protein [Arachidicoccus rhizosphaerae]SEA24693.1 hypothetical protein SAMN05192529_111111 [Arachidicoccus rhizosphaerae]
MINHSKNKRPAFLIAGMTLFAGLTFYSCTKDDTSTADNYQLEGTWQLYKTQSGALPDSTYELSSDNEIIFAPKYYWRYHNGALLDSGTYFLTSSELSDSGFYAQINDENQTFSTLILKGDTLFLSGRGIIMNTETFIKTSDNSTQP